MSNHDQITSSLNNLGHQVGQTHKDHLQQIPKIEEDLFRTMRSLSQKVLNVENVKDTTIFRKNVQLISSERNQ